MKDKIIRKGYIGAMNGTELWVMTQEDEMIKFVVKDRAIHRHFHTQHVKVTIEIIDEDEI